MAQFNADTGQSAVSMRSPLKPVGDVRSYQSKAAGGLIGFDDQGNRIRTSGARLTGKPFNNSILIGGDSRFFQTSTITPGAEYSKMAQGVIPWAQFLTNQSFDFDINDNFGVSGDTTSLLLQRMGPILKSKAGTAIILISTNDASGGASWVNVTRPNLIKIRDLLLDAGKLVIFINEQPRGDSVNTSMRLSGTALKNHLRARQWFNEQSAIPGVIVIDDWQNLADPTSANGDFISSSVSKDGLHMNPLGALLTALSMVPALQSVFPPRDINPYSNADIYDATDNPSGCLNANPMMTGTGGTINGTGGSGSLADNWSENAGPTWTRVYSKVGGLQQVVLGGTGTTGGVSARQVITAGNLAIGDKVQASAYFEFDPSMANVSQVALQLLDNNAIVAGDMRRIGTTEFFPNYAGTLKGVMRTPVYTLTTTTLQLQIQMLVQNALAVAGTFRFGRVALRKVGLT